MDGIETRFDSERFVQVGPMEWPEGAAMSEEAVVVSREKLHSAVVGGPRKKRAELRVTHLRLQPGIIVRLIQIHPQQGFSLSKQHAFDDR